MDARLSQNKVQLPDHEELLLDYAQRLRNHVAGRRALHFQLSRLSSAHRRPQNLRMAVDIFAKLIRNHEGQYYLLRNADLVIVLKGAETPRIHEAVLKIKYLFRDDPLIKATDDLGDEILCTWFDLQAEYPEFLYLVYKLYDFYQFEQDETAPPPAPQAVPEPQPQQQEPPKPAVPARKLAPLDPARLAKLMETLPTQDLTPMLHRQHCCLIQSGEGPRPVFTEIFCSMDDLRDQLMPGVDLAADRWLFQYLTSVIDYRLLKALPEIARATSIPNSINLNVDTVLSNQFLAFDHRMRQIEDKALIIELQPFDIIADMNAFITVKELAKERQYKLCLDGLSSRKLPILNRESLGVDLVKLYWRSDDDASLSDAERRKVLADTVKRAGTARIVLCRCDDEAALNFGHEAGISLFQGHQIDKMLS